MAGQRSHWSTELFVPFLIIDILKQAGDAMPPAFMERDYLWRQYMQKALLDKVIQLDARRQRHAVVDAENKLKAALGGDNWGLPSPKQFRYCPTNQTWMQWPA